VFCRGARARRLATRLVCDAVPGAALSEELTLKTDAGDFLR
jgi:hypothetical protein